MQYDFMPVTPGALIGYTKHGRPIRLIAGGSGEDGDGDGTTGTDPADPGDGAPAADSQDTGTGSTQTDTGSGAAGDTDSGAGATGNTEPTAADRAIAAIRDDFKAERRRRQEAEKRVADIQAALDADKAERKKRDDALAIALGLKSGDEPPDPAKLAEELKAARAEAQAEIAKRDAELKARTVELAVLQAASRQNADGPALLDSRTFLSAVGTLDPADANFAEDLDAAIKKATDAQPRYKLSRAGNGTSGNGQATATVARSGGEHTAPGGNRQWSMDDVERASPTELTKAIEDGLLVDLGYSPRKARR